MNALYGYIAVFVVIVFLGAGWAVEHDKRITYQAKVEQAGADALAQTEKINAKHREEMQNAEHNTIIATNSIADWYRAHPVVRVQNNGCSTMPGTSGDSAGSDDSSTGGYVSPYHPADIEQVANRLDQLQKLLRADGVKVE